MPLRFLHSGGSGSFGRMGIQVIPGLFYSAPLAGGDAGPEQTISMLRVLVDDAWKDPFVRRTAIDVIRNSGAPPYDSWSQIRAIYDFARSFYFVNDPTMKEALSPTRDLLELRAGDCDDINGNLLVALLGAIGFQTRFVTVASDPETPDLYSHIYAEVLIDGEWIPLDAARPGAVFGVAPSYFYKRKWWSVVDSSSGDYPPDNPQAMAGYRPRGIRGLGDFTTDLSAIFSGASSTLRSVSGQLVQPVIGPALGPGGAASYARIAAPAPMSTGTETLLLLALGLLAWKALS